LKKCASKREACHHSHFMFVALAIWGTHLSFWTWILSGRLHRKVGFRWFFLSLFLTCIYSWSCYFLFARSYVHYIDDKLDHIKKKLFYMVSEHIQGIF
jgi:hypothetical protein